MKNLTPKIENKQRLIRTGRVASGLAAVLMFLSVAGSLPAQSIWNGASTTSSNWSDAANWGGTAISSGNLAVFSGTAQRTNVNDLANLTLPSVNFTTTAWNITGLPVAVGGNFTNNVAGTVVWGLNTVLTGGSSGNICENGTGDILNFTGVLSGTGGLGTVAGANGVGTIYLSNTNNNFTGPVGARSGKMFFYSLAPGGQNSSLGAGTSSINIGSSSTAFVGSLTYLGTNSGTTDRGVTFGNNTTGSPAFTNNSPNNSSLTFGGNVSILDGSSANTFTTILAGSSKGTNTFNGIIGPTDTTVNPWGGSFNVYGPGTWAFNNQINVNGNLNVFTNAHVVLGFTNGLAYSSTLFSVIAINPGATLDVSAFDNNTNIFTLGYVSTFPQTLIAGHTSGTMTDINGSLSLVGSSASTLTVASNGVAGTLTINGNFVTGTGTINLDVNTNSASGNDVITVAGNLDLSQGTATINAKAFHGSVQTGVPYTVIAYNGSLIGTASGLNVIPPNGLYTATISTATANIVTVTFAPSGGTIVNLLWQGNASGNWDTTTANWLGSSGSASFSTGNNVAFNDSSSQTNVNLVGQLSANNLTVSNNIDTYTFASSSSGGLADAALLKQGSGSLLISSANSFDEGTTISAGTIQLGSATALGTGGVIFGDTNTGTNVTMLGFSGGVTAANSATVSTNGTGAAIIADLSSSTSVTYNGPIILQRGITFSNANSAVNTFMIQGGITGTGDVTIVGGGGVKLQTGACSFTGNIYVLPGTSGTTLCNVNATLSPNTSISLAAGTQYGIANSAAFNALIGAGSVIAGPGAAFIPNLNFGNGNGSGTFSGIVTTNSGGFTPFVTKNGTGTETFTGDFTGASSGNPTNTGYTTINAGTLAINNTTGTGLNPFGVFVNASGTLAGNGSINEGTNGVSLAGKLIVGNTNDTTGSSFTIVGTGATGNLRINAGGTLMMDLFSGAGAGDNTAISAAADVLNAQTQVAITNGLLKVSNPNNLTAWAIGDKWKIANWSSTVTGVFTNLSLPALPSTLAWDTSALYTSGVIGVIASPNPTAPASITGITLLGSNLLLTGTNMNGGASFHYLVLTTTNLATPLANWTVLSTNSFNANGSFSYTNVLNPAQPAAFFSTKAVQ